MNENTIIAMIATLGVGDFLHNALLGLQASGIDTRIVHVACPDNDRAQIEVILRGFGAHTISLDGFCDLPAGSFPRQYAEYGSRDFIAINWAKLRYLLSLLERHRHVVYADVDVAWLRDPLWYLQFIARHAPLAFQTEAVSQFPPAWCWGFVSMTACDETRSLLNELLRRRDHRPAHAAEFDDQATCCALVAEDPSWMSKVYPLPEGLFINGLGYKGLLKGEPPAAPLQGELSPFTFHANWTVGLENKRALMRQTGTWLLN